MNSSLFDADAATHLKIVLIALAASASLVAMAVSARTDGGPVFGPGSAQPDTSGRLRSR
jgi:hypothetical protein